MADADDVGGLPEKMGLKLIEPVRGMPHDLLDRIARRLVNEVRGINRVVYNISSKPPSTIEWE